MYLQCRMKADLNYNKLQIKGTNQKTFHLAKFVDSRSLNQR